MRMRLGLLHDPEAQRRMFEREQKAADEKKRQAEAPTVRTEEEQKKRDDQKAKDEKDGTVKKKKDESSKKAKIRPLSDARAIELGANFFSETFIFLVAVGLLLLENFRSSRKASNRRDEVQERLEGLETQLERLKKEHNLPELEELNEKLKRSKESSWRWWNPASWWTTADLDVSDTQDTQDMSHSTGQSNNRPTTEATSASPVKPTAPSDQSKVTSGKIHPAEDASPKSKDVRLNEVDAGTKTR